MFSISLQGWFTFHSPSFFMIFNIKCFPTFPKRWLAKQICYARIVIMQRSSITDNITKSLASYRTCSHLFKKQTTNKNTDRKKRYATPRVTLCSLKVTTAVHSTAPLKADWGIPPPVWPCPSFRPDQNLRFHPRLGHCYTHTKKKQKNIDANTES